MSADAPSSNSPKKRKAQGPQQAAPPPTSQPQYTSPSFSQGGSSATATPARRRHSRQRSDLSSRGDSYGRPMSRHQHTESSFSTQSNVSPTQQPSQQGYDSAGASAAEMTPGGRNAPFSAGAPERHDSRGSQQSQQHQYQQQPMQHERRFSVGPEPRREERRSPDRELRERERERERPLSRGLGGVGLPPSSMAASGSRDERR